MEIPGVPVGKIPRKGEKEVQILGLPGVFGVLGIAMEHPSLGGKPILEDIQHIMPRIPVVDDHREIQLRRQIKLGDKKLDLGILIPEFTVIIQTDLPYRYNPGLLNPLFDNLDPIPSGVLHLRRADPNRVIHISRGLQVLVNRYKVMKAIAYRHEPGDRSLTGFLNYDELLNRVITNKPYMSVSIKILHGFVHKEMILEFVQTGYTQSIA
jgi:hypothetical protein